MDAILVFKVLPYIFAILLVVLSDLTSPPVRSYLEAWFSAKTQHIQQIGTAEEISRLPGEERYFKSFVSGSTARVSFWNSMFASFISVIAITSSTQHFWLLACVIVVPLLIFFITWQIVQSYKPDELVDMQETRVTLWGKECTLIRKPPFLFCRLVLIGTNVFLILTVVLASWFAPLPSATTPSPVIPPPGPPTTP